MDMLPNCTKDACYGFHKSATKKQFYDEVIVFLAVIAMLSMNSLRVIAAACCV